MCKALIPCPQTLEILFSWLLRFYQLSSALLSISLQPERLETNFFKKKWRQRFSGSCTQWLRQHSVLFLCSCRNHSIHTALGLALVTVLIWECIFMWKGWESSMCACPQPVYNHLHYLWGTSLFGRQQSLCFFSVAGLPFLHSGTCFSFLTPHRMGVANQAQFPILQHLSWLLNFIKYTNQQIHANLPDLTNVI